MDDVTLDQRIHDPIRPGSISEPQLVDSTTDGRHWPRQRHGEPQPRIEPRQCVREIPSDHFGQILDLPTASLQDDDLTALSHMRDISATTASGRLKAWRRESQDPPTLGGQRLPERVHAAEPGSHAARTPG